MALSAELDDLALGVESDNPVKRGRKPSLPPKKVKPSHKVPAGFYTLAQVIEHTGMARTTIYNMIRSGKFPAPIKFGVRRSGWKVSDCTDYIDKWVYASRGICQ